MSLQQSPSGQFPLPPAPWFVPKWTFRWITGVCGTTALTIGLIVACPMITRKVKQTKAHTLAASASALMEEGKWKEAAPLLMKAYTGNPRDPAVLRACGIYELRGVHNPALCSVYLQQLITLHAATSEDRALLGQSLASNGDLDKAGAMYDSIPEEDRSTRSALELHSLLSARQGDVHAAKGDYQKALMMENEKPEAALKLAVLDMSSLFTELQQGSYEKLWKIARQDVPESLTAIQHLAIHPMLTPPDSAQLWELVTKKENVTEKLRYWTLRSYLAHHPQEREAVLDRETAQVINRKEDQLASLCHWLNSEKEHQRVLQLLPRPMAVKSSSLLVPYLEALLDLEDWKELKDVLQNTPLLPLDAMNTAQLRARCASGLNESPNLVRGYLGLAQKYAERTTASWSLSQLAEVAQSIGYPDIAIDCLRGIPSGSPQQHLRIAKRILTLQRHEGDIHAMLATLKDISASPSSTSDDAESYIYFRLIHGIELETVRDEAEAFARARKISANAGSFFKALCAFRFVEDGELKHSLEMTDPATLPTNWRGVYAGLWATLGDHGKAYRIAEKIPKGPLSEAELVIFKEAL